MVPRQPFNELKPNSGWMVRNSPELAKKKIFREPGVMSKTNQRSEFESRHKNPG
jgi:hypothetical protein